MPQQRRRVKEREPRAVRLAEGILGLLWLWAVFEFATNGSVNLIQVKLTDHINPTPLLVALGLSVPMVAAMIFVVRLRTRAAQSIAQLQAMSPDLFEDWVAARFRELGYTVRVAGSQGDHGVDLLVEKAGEVAAVQCKNYKAWSVGEPILRDLFGAMHDFGAARAYLVTTGRATKAAHDWIKDKPIEIWDQETVACLAVGSVASPLNSHPQAVPPAVASAVADSNRTERAQAPGAAVASRDATCPKCGSVLVEKRNRVTGQTFLACPRYPACRHTQPLA